jgi:zinc metalloprotease ZmpB
MKTIYDPALKANVTRDDDERVRQINHSDEYWDASEFAPKQGADAYVKEMSRLLNIREGELAHLQQSVSYWDPREQGVEYRLSEERPMFDSTTIGYMQTALNVPIWGAGLTVTMKHGPNRVVACTFNGRDDVQASLPSREAIDRFLKQFVMAERERAVGVIPAPGEGAVKEGESATAAFIRGLLATRGRGGKRAPAAKIPDAVRLIRGRFFLYKYDPDARLSKHPEPMPETLAEEQGHEPTLPLPPVPDAIKLGQYYLVGEITFAVGGLVWLALVEVETRAILYLRALASGVNGMVFTLDPISSSGSAANTPDKNNATLNPFRSSELLPNLNAPVAGTQSLAGSRARVMNVEDPNIAPPTEATGVDFNFDVRTNNFAAVSAYYHVDRLFQVIENLGFPLGTYFDGTTFPVAADHRDFPPDGLTINAHCIGNGTGGIGHVGYALNDLSDTTNPIGRAADPRVTWHELGGHGILYDHLNSANFGFCHSAGDSLSIIFHDPTSNAPDRFRYAPWNPINLRRADRDVTAGWAWGGIQDDTGYGSEEILETTLFRVYRSIGGDSTDINRRRFASRMMMYLILRAVGTLTPGTNPGNALTFANTLMAVDLLNWTSEGVYGGAYNKVLRWSFEKQGLFQPPGAPTPVATAGAPPAVDVYIDDGRAGEYQYLPVHWATTTIWNRRHPDGGTTHQEPKLGHTNYAYVKIKNRGTSVANNVIVKGYHCKPAAGVLWPNDLQPMTTTQLSAGTLQPNDAEEKVVGPFEWTPVVNGWGHDCMMMIVSAPGDPSNVDNFTAGEYVEDWRLVPNDNNVGQRNVTLAPGGGGMKGLMTGLHGKGFWVGNPGRRGANVAVSITLPPLLASRGWRITLRDLPEGGARFKAREQRLVTFEVHPGTEFTKADTVAEVERDIVVTATADGGIVGGMVYHIDPDLEMPFNELTAEEQKEGCRDKARELLDCLDLPGGKVKRVCVRKVAIDVEMKCDDCCSD